MEKKSTWDIMKNAVGKLKFFSSDIEENIQELRIKELENALHLLISKVDDYACAGLIEAFWYNGGSKESNLSDVLHDANEILNKRIK